MPIEPQHAYTVLRRPLMPPKEEPKVLKPKMTFEADAKRCNARLARIMGSAHDGSSGREANRHRMNEAAARREEIALSVLELIGEREMRRSEIEAALGITENQSRCAMAKIKLDGRAVFRKAPGGAAIWRAA